MILKKPSGHETGGYGTPLDHTLMLHTTRAPLDHTLTFRNSPPPCVSRATPTKPAEPLPEFPLRPRLAATRAMRECHVPCHVRRAPSSAGGSAGGGARNAAARGLRRSVWRTPRSTWRGPAALSPDPRSWHPVSKGTC